MRKNILFFFFLFCIALQGHAQEFRLGVIGGVTFNDPSHCNYKTGFRAGVKGELEFNSTGDGWYADMGVLLTSLGVNMQPSFNQDNSYQTAEYIPHYLSIPLHMGYKWSVGKQMKLFAHAGPYFNIGLFGSIDQQIVKASGESKPVSVNYDNTNVFNAPWARRFNWGAGVSAGVEINRHFQVSVGYDWSFNSFASTVSDLKHRTLHFSCAHIF